MDPFPYFPEVINSAGGRVAFIKERGERKRSLAKVTREGSNCSLEVSFQLLLWGLLGMKKQMASFVLWGLSSASKTSPLEQKGTVMAHVLQSWPLSSWLITD
ncbi:hypothetical protein AVEN_204969-1 [Araneus ventricosus]|uniref:Uncharacterized protein n=1 Tax=Araneus ventricosus TaxID=182803 RepID=A0A4Y2NZN6_ARAVE|nr:hypothetical protein AVEN_204969-1 [Araneus ventricosus]